MDQSSIAIHYPSDMNANQFLRNACQPGQISASTKDKKLKNQQ